MRRFCIDTKTDTVTKTTTSKTTKSKTRHAGNDGMGNPILNTTYETVISIVYVKFNR